MADPSVRSIAKFTGEHGFLSNFYPSPILIDGETYPTVEHAFQAMKTLDLGERARVHAAATPGRAKQLGRRVALRPGWADLRIEVMRFCLREKFRDLELAARLEATGDAELVEGNHWRDTFWGVVDGQGENWLGRLLMEVRTNLRMASSSP